MRARRQCKESSELPCKLSCRSPTPLAALVRHRGVGPRGVGCAAAPYGAALLSVLGLLSSVHSLLCLSVRLFRGCCSCIVVAVTRMM